MSITEFRAALNQVATERGISVESILESIKMALVTAYKKDRQEAGEDVEDQEFEAKIESDSGEVKIMKGKKDVTPAGFGRIAAQTAKQVIMQKIRETEKDMIISEFKAKLGQIVIGHIFRMENGIVTLDLGKSKSQGIMPQSEQVQSETYRLNQRIKVLVKDIRQSTRGTEIIVSRSDAELVKKLFEQEVPEIASGVVTIEAIAREAGSRTKMAVSSKDDKVDPVGSCVGQKGVRVQSIITELFGEKIDIVPFSAVPEKFIAASLSPAKVTDVQLNVEENRATVTVPEDQQSLAIGKEGQNARLSNKLTKWKIDIKGAAPFGEDSAEETTESKAEKETKDSKKKVVGVWDAQIKETTIKTKKAKKDKDDAEAAEKADSEKSEEPVAEAQSTEEAPEADQN